MPTETRYLTQNGVDPRKNVVPEAGKKSCKK